MFEVSYQGMNDSNTLKAMRSRGIGTEETDRLKNAKDGSAWDFPENSEFK
jgi:hypothetical protein